MTFGLGRWVVRVALVLGSRSLTAQDTTHAAAAAADTSTARDSTTPSHAGHFHIGLTIHGYGLDFGNARRITGIRVNVQDAELDRVNGINVTLWKPREPLSGTVNGLQVGLLPGSRQVSGIAIGIGGVVTEGRARWVTIGGLGAVSNGAIEGIGIGGLGLVADGPMRGIGIGGLGAVSNRDIHGIVVGGLGTVANEDIRGIAVAGLGTVANRDIIGIAFGGLGTVANRDVTGAGLAGLALVANGSITGVGIGGLAVVANERLTGLGIGGLAVVADREIRGLAFAGYSVDSHQLEGVSVSAYNRIRGPQRGLAIGLYNSALELHGVQIGVLNRAKNNRAPFKILPLLNVHL
ncbi:MAG TPA: hypothetical protein VEU74_05025 [Gemmatimonadales bacterium]|nr:hypothetical protein [Gemmatimonadales bacterium]